MLDSVAFETKLSADGYIEIETKSLAPGDTGTDGIAGWRNRPLGQTSTMETDAAGFKGFMKKGRHDTRLRVCSRGHGKVLHGRVLPLSA